MAKIRIEGLEKRYDARRVLGPVDLAIEDGEFFTFVGPSGCGKSTLLNLIAGVDTAERRPDLVRRSRGERARRREIATSRWCSRATRCIRT